MLYERSDSYCRTLLQLHIFFHLDTIHNTLDNRTRFLRYFLQSHHGSGRSSHSYAVVTLTATGTRDNSPLAGPAVSRFWGRLKPTQRVTVQRFVAPGYHLTGKVVAIANDTSVAMTRYHPDSGTHYDAMDAFLGTVTAGVGIALLVARRRS